MSDQKGRLEAIFHIAKELADAEERDIYLREVCQGDPQMRSRLERLLDAADDAESLFAEAETSAEAASALMGEVPLSEGPGTRIGRYKLLQKIGEGGMGVVYMAEQVEPVNRQVALKIIKLGMDTKQVVARFEAERQALALMDHPNIAKVLDAGATDSGRPYFVMELVRGAPITEYCDKNRLGITERLKLFVPVCQAIQHAHQKGILHRDIKPSNVLVTLHDGSPVAKVIDFGIAKATNQKLTEKTLFTHFSQMIGTPAYMSPEQAEMSGLDVDTRSDVYSLGVLLYELLTGSTPFPSKDLLSAGYGEMRRIISETEPQKPSARVSTFAGEERTLIAKNRHIEIPSLLKEIQGDLDWIIMKALEKDRTRRYETVNGLAEDVRRHLNEEPVSAVAPTLGYQMSKLYRRHKGIIRAAALVMALLGLSTAVSGWLAVKATRATRVAEEQTQVARGINGFLNDDLFGQADAEIQADKDVTLRQVLDRASGAVQDRFPDQPLVEAGVRLAIGRAYYSLQEVGRAEPHLQRAFAIRRDVLGPEAFESIEAEYRLIQIGRMKALMDKTLLDEYLQPETGGDVLDRQRVLAMYQSLKEKHGLDSWLAREIEIELILSIPDVNMRESMIEGAFERAWALENTPSLESASYLCELSIALNHEKRTRPLMELALRMIEGELGRDSQHLLPVRIRYRLKRHYEENVTMESAVEVADLHRRYVEAFAKQYGDSTMTTLREKGNYALSLEDIGQMDGALNTFEQAAKVLLERYGMGNNRCRWIHSHLAMRYGTSGRYDDALRVCRLYETYQTETGSTPDDSQSGRMATLFARKGEWNAAIELRQALLEERLETWEKRGDRATEGSDSFYSVLNRFTELGLLYEAAGMRTESRNLREDARAFADELFVLAPAGSELDWEKKFKFVTWLDGPTAGLEVARELSREYPSGYRFQQQGIYEALRENASAFRDCVVAMQTEEEATWQGRVLRVCLLWEELNPCSAEELATIYTELNENLAENAISYNNAWAEVGLGLYAYRQGWFTKAIEHVGRLDQLKQTENFHFRGGLAKGLLIQAMSEHRLGRTREARETFALAQESMRGYYPPEGGRALWGHNTSVILYDKLVQEAAPMFGLEEASASVLTE